MSPQSSFCLRHFPDSQAERKAQAYLDERVCIVSQNPQGAARHAVTLVLFFQWAYGSANRLIVRYKDGDIAVKRSSRGVQQGNPAEGLLFFYGMKRAMESLARCINPVDKVAQIVANLDNLYIIIKSHALAAVKISLAAVFKPPWCSARIKLCCLTLASINPLMGQRS